MTTNMGCCGSSAVKSRDPPTKKLCDDSPALSPKSVEEFKEVDAEEEAVRVNLFVEEQTLDVCVCVTRWGVGC